MTTAPDVTATDPSASASVRRVPRLREVLRAQVRATGFTLRFAIVLAAMWAVVATIFVALQVAEGDMPANLHAQPSALPGIIGALLPVGLWAREERFGPGYMWTLPVDRTTHALIRVLAGWTWLMAGAVLYVTCQLVLAISAGGDVLPVETLHVLTTSVRGRGPLEPDALQAVRWAPGASVWLVPFTAATATYLLASAAMLGIRRPFRWALAAVLTLPVLAIVGRQLTGRSDLADRVVEALLTGPYGLDALLTMRTATLDHRVTLTTGERLHAWMAVPDVADWRLAVLLWTSAGLLAVLAAALTHRERRRS